MTSSRVQLYLDKENASQFGVVSRGKSALSVGTSGGKTFLGNASKQSLQTPRRALGDVNRDVSRPLSHKENSGMKKKEGPVFNMKKPILQMRPPVPASKPPNVRSFNKNESHISKKKQMKTIQQVARKESVPTKPAFVDEVECMHVYQDSEEEYEEIVFPKHERPSTFLYKLGHWQPSMVIEDSANDSDSESDLNNLSDINPEILQPPQLHNSLVEESALELSLEPEPEDLELVSFDNLELMSLERL